MASMLVSAIGFNEAPIVRAIVVVKPSFILLVAPKASGDAAAKLDSSISVISQLAGMTTASLDVLRVDDPSDIGSVVFNVKRRVENAVASGVRDVYVALRGGLRLLTLSLLLTAQSLAASYTPDELKVAVIAEDAQGKLRIFEAASLLPERVVGDERRLLRVLAEKTLKGEGLSVREAASLLGIPKSTAHKRLRALQERSLAVRSGEGYKATLKGIISS